MEALSVFEWSIDLLIGLCLLSLAGWTLASPNLFRAVVLFVAFSLFMALAWVRLAAPDVALAEAAIGAGLTGALLMSAMARLHSPSDGDGHRSSADAPQTDGRPPGDHAPTRGQDEQ